MYMCIHMYIYRKLLKVVGLLTDLPEKRKTAARPTTSLASGPIQALYMYRDSDRAWHHIVALGPNSVRYCANGFVDNNVNVASLRMQNKLRLVNLISQ
jgi:hypothetical protein